MYRKSLRKFLLSFLRISRANIQVASLPHALLGICLGISSFSFLFTLPVLIYIFLCFALITFACNINCLYDLEVDKKYKKYLANAVEFLGRDKIKIILVLESFLIFFLIFILSEMSYRITASIAVLGYILSIVYSAPPFRMKARGFLSPFPCIIGLYTLPLLGGWFLFNTTLPPYFLVFVISYALMNEGITLVNTCEDYSEDLKEGIKTWAHVFGLKNALRFAFVFTLAGMGCIISLFFKVLVEGNTFTLILISLASFTIFQTARDIHKVSKARDLEKSAKKYAPNMPKWFMSTRYPLLITALSLLF